jgi:hypothetical protein
MSSVDTAAVRSDLAPECNDPRLGNYIAKRLTLALIVLALPTTAVAALSDPTSAHHNTDHRSRPSRLRNSIVATQYGDYTTDASTHAIAATSIATADSTPSRYVDIRLIDRLTSSGIEARARIDRNHNRIPDSVEASRYQRFTRQWPQDVERAKYVVQRNLHDASHVYLFPRLMDVADGLTVIARGRGEPPPVRVQLFNLIQQPIHAAETSAVDGNIRIVRLRSIGSELRTLCVRVVVGSDTLYAPIRRP